MSTPFDNGYDALDDNTVWVPKSGYVITPQAGDDAIAIAKRAWWTYDRHGRRVEIGDGATGRILETRTGLEGLDDHILVRFGQPLRLAERGHPRGAPSRPSPPQDLVTSHVEARVLWEALTQFIENSEDIEEEMNTDQKLTLGIAREMLDRFNAYIAQEKL